ncbi:general stress protein [Halobacillus halophilus]|uniref:general stress protein n=1 Tax=Halobacillus halophilus TaxID=1570 RepID=UPI001CD1ACA9|nr:general stress protein [Halobacillus halophilus]MCA1010767.1 general stress protein [Halobacillus halophilus]
MDKKIIGGVFSKVGNAEQAIMDLQHHGYGSDNISVFAKDKSKVAVLEDEMDTSVSSNKGGRGKNSGKGAGLGALSGGVLGGIGGLIAGLGLLAIPGLGQIAAAGPIAAALTGAGVGAGGGGIVGALVGAGMSENDARMYESHLKEGKVIVIVEATEKLQDKVYRAFITNKTENKSMYPEPYNENTHDAHRDSSAHDRNHDTHTNTESHNHEYDSTHNSTDNHRNSNTRADKETRSHEHNKVSNSHDEHSASTRNHGNPDDPFSNVRTHEPEKRTRTSERHHSSHSSHKRS